MVKEIVYVVLNRLCNSIDNSDSVKGWSGIAFTTPTGAHRETFI